MKKITYILSVLSLIFLSSCEVEDGDYYTNRTAQGKLAFDQVQSYSNDIVYLTEMVSRASLYINTPQGEKEAYKTYYFANHTVQENSEKRTIELKGKNATWTIAHNGKSINQAGANWNITLTVTSEDDDYTIVKPTDYILESKGDKNWTLTITKLAANIEGIMYNQQSLGKNFWALMQENAQTVALEVTAKQAVAQSSNLYNYTLESGMGYSMGKVAIHYTIQSPVVYSSDINQRVMRMKDGAIDIELTTGMIKEEIKAQMEDESITITMKGISETYKYWDYFFWY